MAMFPQRTLTMGLAMLVAGVMHTGIELLLQSHQPNR